MIKDDRIYLTFILECIEDLSLHMQGNSREYFLANKTAQKAILRTLHELTETTQRLSKELKSDLPDIDWRAISGFRNILVHEYLGNMIDLQAVWTTLDKQIPQLKASLKNYYQQKYS